MIELKDIRRLESYNVLLIGDSCIDKYHYGTCDRISPEAPVPVMHHLYTKEYPGMAANVLENLKGLNLTCEFKTNDHLIMKERYVDQKSKQQFLRVDSGENIITKSLDHIDHKKYDAIVISDYNKGYITDNFVGWLTKEFSGIIFVDSKKKDLSCFDNCIVKINEKERSEAIKLPKSSEIIVTLGENGAIWNDQTYSTQSVDVFDASGAGDSFFAGLIVSYLISSDIEESINFANLCARVAVQKNGTYAVNLKDVFL